jgi:hypothetical protein
MPGRYGNIDYSTYTKGGFLFGLALFAIAALSEIVIHLGNLQIQSGLSTLLLDVGLAGIVVMVAAPIVFGVIMPLTE